MVRKAIVICAVLVAVLGILAGCGGGSSTVSKQEFNQQLRLVCNKGEQAREALLAKLTKDYYEKREETATPQYQAENLRKMIAVYEGTTEQIEAIGLPEGEERKAEEMIKTREGAAAKVQASPLGTRDALEIIFKEANEQAESYGAHSCVL